MNHPLWPPNGNLAQYILDQFEPGYIGWAVDVGASDGVSINTTYHLENPHRWTVLSVEANPDYAPMLRKYRARVELCACSDHEGEEIFHVHQENPEAFSSLKPTPRADVYPTDGQTMTWKTVRVPVRTIEQLLAKWEFPRLDVLCVDTEGTELDVLKGCDLAKWQPRVIVTECWDKVGPIDPYLEALGYKKTARSVHNDIFLRREP